jgi:alkylhydroperoxidase family enzyme
VVAAVLADWRTAPIRPELRATLGFLEKVAKGTPTAADAKEVLDAGVSRAGLERAVDICAAFTMIAKMADTFGFRLDDDAGYAAGAKMLWKRGYGR